MPYPPRARTIARPVTLARTVYNASLAAFVYLAIALTVTLMAAILIASIALANPAPTKQLSSVRPASFMFLVTTYTGNTIPVVDVIDHSLSGEDCIARLVEHNLIMLVWSGIASCEQE